MRALNTRLDIDGHLAEAEDFQAAQFERLLFAVRRQWKLVAAAVAAFLLLGVVYLLVATPLYSSTASILIDTGNQKIVDQMSAVSGVMDDEASVLSQVELIKSGKVAQAVIDKLQLKDNEAFASASENPLKQFLKAVKDTVKSMLFLGGQDEQPTDMEINNQLLETLGDNVDIERVNRTYVLDITYTSAFPQLSADIAAAFGEAYLNEQLDSKYEATRRASEWLQNRISDLRKKSLEADIAVQKFKEEKGLISADGKLITEQQLSQISNQLGLARDETAKAEAQYKRIKGIIDSGQMDAVVTDALQSDVITKLREKFLEASRAQADISGRLGENHVQAIRLRTEMSEYRRLMFEELSRIAQSYQSSYQVALNRQTTLEGQLQEARKVTSSANNDQVQLRELERESETYKNLYQTFLTRYQESVQQQSFPVTEARIITQPVVAAKPSAPKTLLVLALAIVLGGATGAGIGVFREFRDRFFRTGDQVREELELDYVGPVPMSTRTSVKAIRNRQHSDATLVSKSNKFANYVVDHPFSAFAETLRAAKVAADSYIGRKKPKVIGFVSSLPNEGKSTISINFAELLASQGLRVLLVDADLRNPGATRQLGRHAERGVLEVLRDDVPLMDLTLKSPTGLVFLPAILKHRVPNSSDLLASDAMDRLLAQASAHFDYVVLDLPPLAPVIDARAISDKLDAYLFVIEWGRTARRMVRKILAANPAVNAKCCGAILNKVDSKKMNLYREYGSSEYYEKKYTAYYQEG